MPQLSAPRVLVVCGHCPINPMVQNTLSECVVTIAELGEDLPADFHDLELVETHLSIEEWNRIWELKRDRQANQRIHICLAQPISAIYLRNVLEEYGRRRIL